MAAKSAHEAAKAKAAKEKKILIVLAVPLAIALFFAYHTVTKLHKSSAPEVVAPAATPGTATTASSSTTPATTVATGTPVSATLPTAPAPPPDAGKLSRLTLLSSKDPFFDQGPHVTAAGGSSTKQTNQSTQPKQKTASVPPASAVIAVNGRLSLVAVGEVFPLTKDSATNGIFRLVGLTAKSAKVAVVGGSYTTGARALTLTVNSVVTLLNTADGKRYTLILYPPGTPTPGATQTTGAPTTTTTGP
ncbi:MAG: hypothetical protein ACRDLM_03690 [Gaiellaceae bacterium]